MRLAVIVSASILGLTSLGKFFALSRDVALLDQPHPFLPANYRLLMWLALIAEGAAVAVLWRFGARRFLEVCLGLSAIFITYHALEAGFHVEAPCPCLGGLLGRWEHLAVSESLFSFLLAGALALAAFSGLFHPPTEGQQPQAQPSDFRAAMLAACLLWLCAGSVVVWAWQGRVLGGDEGLEAAKSLQFVRHADASARMWNDQPPAWSHVGGLFFHAKQPSLTAARILVVLLTLLLPITLAVTGAASGAPWAAPATVGILWLAIPAYNAAFMLEGPASALGVASLLPLVLSGQGWKPLVLSAAIAALALSVKLTAAFALVVPFVWLLGRAVPRAVGWGVLVVALTAAGSLLQPGWHWREMFASHSSVMHPEALGYRPDPALFANNWFACLLAVAAVAIRYVNGRLTDIMPWLVAFFAALGIHLVHRPYWDYYAIHLMTPVAVLAGFGASDLVSGTWLRIDSPLLRRVVTVGVFLLGTLWGGQRIAQIQAGHAMATNFKASPITAELTKLREQGETGFSMNPIWTFAAGLPQTPPELTIIPLKRVWSGQLNDAMIAALLATNRVGGIVISHGESKLPEWSGLLTGYVATARTGHDMLFVRRDLNPKPLSEDESLDLFKKLGL